jgi:predicted nucleic acid-binding protein
MIAATAIVADATLVTRNGPDFVDVPRLDFEAWLIA